MNGSTLWVAEAAGQLHHAVALVVAIPRSAAECLLNRQVLVGRGQ